MNSFIPLFCALWLGAASIASGAIIGTNSSALPLTLKRISSLPSKEQGAWKEYLQRSEGQMLADKNFFISEMKKHGIKQSAPAPKGRSESRVPLNKPDEWYREPEALRIADIVLSFQTPAGGWTKGVDMTSHRRAPGEQFFGDSSILRLSADDNDAPREFDWHYVGTFDNGATITQLRYLAKVANAVEPKRGEPYRTSFLRGLEYIFSAQFPNGGWPQVWPLQGGYSDAITYNDDAMSNVMQLLSDVAKGKNDFAFVPQQKRDLASNRIQRGIQCILDTQITVNGRRTAWCQQHDALTLQATSARNYEMPAQCGSESSKIIMFLMQLPKPDRRIVAAIHATALWLEKTKLMDVALRKDDEQGKRLISAPGEGPLWARYYEIGADRPIFGDRDKTIHDDMNEISKERRNGYSWFNDSPKRALQQYAEWKETFPAAISEK